MMSKTNDTIDSINLPDEILLNEILKYLDDLDLIHLSLVNQRINKIVKNDVFWKLKFQLHFYHRLASSPHSNSDNWYKLFAVASLEDYSKSTRHLFFISKEGNRQSFNRSLTQRKFSIYDLIEAKDNNYLTPLDWLIRKDHQHFLNFVFENARETFFNKEVKKLKITDKKKLFLIHWAILCNQSEDVIQSYLVDKTFKKQPSTLYHLAAEFGLNEKIKLLHNLSAHHNECGSISSHLTGGIFSEFTSQTPLHLAAAKGHAKTVALLLDQGAQKDAFMIQYRKSERNSSNKKITPLHQAAKYNQIEVVEILLAKDCSPIEPDDANNSALLYAIQNKNSHLFSILLNKIDKQNDNDTINRALLYCVNNNQYTFIQPLLDKGANPYWISSLPDFILTKTDAITVAAYLASKGQKNALSILISNIKERSLNVQTLDMRKIGAFLFFFIGMLISVFIFILFITLHEYQNVDINLATFILTPTIFLLCTPIAGALAGIAYSKYTKKQSQLALENITADLEQQHDSTPLLNSVKNLDIEQGLKQIVSTSELTINDADSSLQNFKKFMFLDGKPTDLAKPESSNEQDDVDDEYEDDDELPLITLSKKK